MKGKVVPAPTFDPADGETENDNTTDITLTFAEAIKSNATNTDFTDTTIDGILTLKAGSSSGTNIDFDATINGAKTKITIDPTSNLSDGDVYVAISSAYYDGEGNQGGAASATFTVDTTGPAPTFDPANGETETDKTTDITLTFGEAIRKDDSGTALTNSDLSSILTLRETNASGTDIPYSATINSEKTVITIDPSGDLSDGDVYVAISNGYYDGEGNQGDADNATFTVDTTAPSVTFDPADGDTEANNTRNITLTFGEAIKKDNVGTDFGNGDLSSILTLKEDSSGGQNIPYSATINSEKTVITIDPSGDLSDGDVYVAISNAYYDSEGNQGDGDNATFTVDTTASAVTFDLSDGDTVTDNTRNITLTFGEAIKSNASNVDFTDSSIDNILTLKTTNSSGENIGFDATINSEKTVITIDPSGDLSDGAVYVTISNGYYDSEGNQGRSANATFTVDTTGPAVTFDPADGDTEANNTRNITLTFGEAIKKDNVGTDFGNGDLSSILTLKEDSSGGQNIPYSATINSEKTVITIDPSGDLSDGAVYVTISNGYYDSEGNQGRSANATFTVDTTGPAVTFDPADGDTETNNTRNITLTFGEAIKKDNVGTDFGNGDLSSILTLKAGSSSGQNIPYSATINDAKTVITIDSSGDLSDGDVYVAISNGYYDSEGNQGRSANATFTVDTTAPVVTFDPADSETVTNNTRNITLTFDEAIKSNASNVDFTDSTIANILTLKAGSSSGQNIPYSASINSEKTVITIDPSGDLSDGDVYVAISNGYYDSEGNQGDGDNATFTVDTTAPSVTFDPADGDTETDNTRNITLTFDEAIKSNASNTDFTDSSIDNILMLKTTNASGADINFDASINSEKTVITINPTSNLADGKVYVAISNAYYDSEGNRGLQASATFTVAPSTSTNADLSNLTAGSSTSAGGTYTDFSIGTFAAATTTYTASVANTQTHVKLTPTVDDTGKATVGVRKGTSGNFTSVTSGTASGALALDVGANTLVVRVTAQDGTTTKDYTVTVTRQAAVTLTNPPLSSPRPSINPPPPLPLEETPPPVVTIAAVEEAVTEGGAARFTVNATPAPAPGTSLSVSVSVSQRGDFASSGQTGIRSIPVDDSGTASFSVSTEDDAVYEEDGAVTATVGSGNGYTPHASSNSAEVTIRDNDHPVVTIEAVEEEVTEGGAARFTVSATPVPAPGTSLNVRVRVSQRGDVAASGQTGPRTVVVDESGTASFSVSTEDDALHEQDGILTAVVEEGTGYTPHASSNSAAVTVRDNDPLAAAPTAEQRAWLLRFGRTVSQQVVDALQQRFSSSAQAGLELNLAGESLTSATPLEENHVLLSRLLGFEKVSGQELAQGSSFSFSGEGAGPRLSFWGSGALSSFNGSEDTFNLRGDVTTALVGAEWSSERWRAGAALSHSRGSGSFQGGRGAGEISGALTGLFPYGRYALTPRLGIWATAGYGWGSLSHNPDGYAPEYNPVATMSMGALGMEGLLLEGGSDGVTLTTTADVLLLKTSSEAVEGLPASNGNLSRFRLGLEATRPFLLSNGSSLSPSLELGIRQDRGDAETGFGMDLGASLSWSAPERGVSAVVKGRTLLSHGAEHFQEKGLALSFSWQPTPSERGVSLSVSHAVGGAAEGGMASLLHPTAIEVLDAASSDGERFEARLAYGFPFYNDRLTITPSVAAALSPSSRSYSLLWSVAPYAEQPQLHGEEPWELSLEGERQENLSSSPSSPVDHSLKLLFSLPF